MVQSITPHLWFDGNAEEAVGFYVSTFPGARVTQVLRGTGAGPAPEGSLVAIGFEVAGQEIVAINGGPHFQFTPAVSLLIACEDQAELDRSWDALLEGGEPMQCGWIKDRFGMTWQGAPAGLRRLLWDGPPEPRARAMQAMMGMQKLDLATLTRAYEGAGT